LSISRRKKATRNITLISIVSMCSRRDEKSILPISSIQHGLYGIEGVALSMPAVVGKNGVETLVPIELNEAEQTALRHSADTLKQVLNEVL